MSIKCGNYRSLCGNYRSHATLLNGNARSTHERAFPENGVRVIHVFGTPSHARTIQIYDARMRRYYMYTTFTRLSYNIWMC